MDVRQEFNRHSDTDLYDVVTDLLKQTDDDFSVMGRYLTVENEYYRRKKNAEGIKMNNEMLALFNKWEQSTDESERDRIRDSIDSYF